MPISVSVTLMNSAKLSARTTPNAERSRFHSSTDAMAAPIKPMMPSPPIGTRSPFGRNASATIVTTAERVTISIGMIA